MHDPVAQARRSRAALDKVAGRQLDDGVPVHSFRTLLYALSGIVRNTCRAPVAAAEEPTFEVVTTATAQQHRALDLIAQIKLQPEPAPRKLPQLIEVKGQCQRRAGGLRLDIAHFRSPHQLANEGQVQRAGHRQPTRDLQFLHATH
jgi:hypothetical protein